jgi:hypothetical protein
LEQDAWALHQLVGEAAQAPSPAAGDTDEAADLLSDDCSSDGEAGQPAAQAGLLSSLTLQALLGEDHGSPQQRGGTHGGGGVQASALAGYMSNLESNSNLLQRQLAHLHASTGGGGARPLRTARHLPGRREVFVLSKWLEV